MENQREFDRNSYNAFKETLGEEDRHRCREKKCFKLHSTQKTIYNKDNMEISHKTDLEEFTTEGLTWGYNGPGVRQASIAILWEFSKNDKLTMDKYIDFADEILEKLTQNKNHIITYYKIRRWIENKENSEV